MGSPQYKYPQTRPRRLRQHAVLRDLSQEHHVQVSQLVLPLFVQKQSQHPQTIATLPGVLRHSLTSLLKEIEACMALGLRAFALFPALSAEEKTPTGTAALDPKGLYLNTLQQVHTAFPEALLIGDVALDPYSSDGHDGLVRQGQVLNDETLPLLGDMAVAQAQAGAHVIAPSDMMDGRVGYLRKRLDQAGFTQIPILAYTAKYASALYAPFREALDSKPAVGDKKTYQMNPANAQEALLEAVLDAQEGADWLMVKPAGFYLDIIYRLAQTNLIPIAAYQVSGEYAMIMAAAQAGALNLEATILESLLALRRAGASTIFTYFAKQVAELNNK